MKTHRAAPSLLAPQTAQAPTPEVVQPYGNAAALDAMATGTTGALPFLAEMEAAFGTSFSDVRALFGADLDGIDAAAAAHGATVAFADPHPDRATVAHELTHVVQARGGAPGGGVARADHPAEHEADRVSEAVVRGEEVGPITAAAAGVHRQPRPNSYSGGEPPKKSYLSGQEPTWSGGVELTAAEHQQFLERSAGAITATVGLSVKLWGVAFSDGEGVREKLAAQAEAELDGEIRLREAEIGHFESEIEWLEDLDVRSPREEEILRDKRARLPALLQQLEAVEAGRDTALERATAAAVSVAGAMSSYGGSVAKIGAAFSGGLGRIRPDQFASIDDSLGKIDTFTQAVHAAAVFGDRRSLDAFQANPSFETAKAWGADVGTMFAAIAPLASGLPNGWGDVISGALEMPGKVIAGMTGLMERRQAELDAALSGYGCRESQLLDEGTSSRC